MKTFKIEVSWTPTNKRWRATLWINEEFTWGGESPNSAYLRLVLNSEIDHLAIIPHIHWASIKSGTIPLQAIQFKERAA